MDGKTRKNEITRKSQDVGGWIILKYILERGKWDGMDSSDLTQDRNQWRALLNTVMNLWVS
jgi:hypothetical protein